MAEALVCFHLKTEKKLIALKLPFKKAYFTEQYNEEIIYFVHVRNH